MYRRIIWITFLILLSALALGFIVKAGYQVYRYFQFNIQKPATIHLLSIKEIHSDQFGIQAIYTYEYGEKSYRAQGNLGGIYPNPWAAQEAKKRLNSQKQCIWIHSKHPDQSVLEKHFPYKKTISAAVLVGLVIYFLILGGWVRMKT